MSSELVLLNGAESALELATTIPEITSVRDVATGARAFAKSRGLGVEAENKAAEVILRAERKIGQALIDMALDGARAVAGADGGVFSAGANQFGAGTQGEGALPATLADFGFSKKESANWQRLARLPEDDFEAMLRAAHEARERIAKIDFYRIPADKAAQDDQRETAEDADFIAFRISANALISKGLMQLPDDELRLMAGMLQSLVSLYQEAKEARGG